MLPFVFLFICKPLIEPDSVTSFDYLINEKLIYDDEENEEYFLRDTMMKFL